MANRKKLYLVGFVLIACALGYLMMTSFRSSLQYYVTVNEALADKEHYKDKILKVAGKADGIVRVEENGKAVYKFNLIQEANILPVSYTGFVPDTFKNGADVVATGTMGGNGTFVATHILAKCASKYQEKSMGGM